MYEEWYAKISRPFRSPGAAQALAAADKLLVYAIAAVYLVALAWLAAHLDTRFWRAALVPAFTFALVTLLRAKLDAPRPYERCRIDPLIPKGTRGKSLPSRHVASACTIACALAWLQPAAGGVALAACAAVCFTRIVGGVHFPRDVAAAVALAGGVALVGFVLL